MKVRHEPALPDVSYKVRAPLILDLEGQRFHSVDRWSLEGIGLTPDMAVTSGFGLLTIPFQGFGITLQIQVVRDDKAGLLRFVNLGNREFAVLRHFYREIVTGRAVGMDRMIYAMDAPVDLVPMEETAAERKAGQARVVPRAIRAATVVCLFLALAMMAYRPLVDTVVAQSCFADEPLQLASR